MTLQKFAQSNAPDEGATVAWSANLSPFFEIIEIGQTSGKSTRMEFLGPDGFVILEPNEEGPVTKS